jgi:3D (Asp-Asp-Asp) domain-containing protein
MNVTILVLLGTLTVTSYRPIKSQTDNSPTWTSIGDMTTMYGVAVSQDFLKSGKIHYGDVLYIPGFGFRIANDCMHKRKRNSIDLLVFTKREEIQIGTRHLKVYKIKLLKGELK